MSLLGALDLRTTALDLHNDLAYVSEKSGGSYLDRKVTIDMLLGAGNMAPGGRLTLKTNTPVPADDQIGKSVVYYTAFRNNLIWLYSSPLWYLYDFTADLSLTLSGLTTGKNYDVFCSIVAGTPTLSLGAAWTNDTTRSAALTRLNGLRALGSDTSKLYLGTIRATSATTTCDVGGLTTSTVIGKRFLVNEYNRCLRQTGMFDSGASFTSPYDYGGGTYQWGNEWLALRRNLVDDPWEVQLLVVGEANIRAEAFLSGATTLGSSSGHYYGLGISPSGISGGSSPLTASVVMPIAPNASSVTGARIVANARVTTEGYTRIGALIHGPTVAADFAVYGAYNSLTQFQSGLIAGVET